MRCDAKKAACGTPQYLQDSLCKFEVNPFSSQVRGYKIVGQDFNFISSISKPLYPLARFPKLVT